MSYKKVPRIEPTVGKGIYESMQDGSFAKQMEEANRNNPYKSVPREIMMHGIGPNARKALDKAIKELCIKQGYEFKD